MDESRLREIDNRINELNSEQIQRSLAEEKHILTTPEVDEILVIASVFRGEVHRLRAQVAHLTEQNDAWKRLSERNAVAMKYGPE